MKGWVPGVAEVAVGVDGGSAGIPADVSAISGLELFLDGEGGTSWLLREFFSLSPVRKGFCIEYKKL